MLEARREEKAAVRIGICIPSTGVWMADFGSALVQMMCYTSFMPFEIGQERHVDLIEKRSSNLPRLRQELLEDAILRECTHAVMIDTDQFFPQDTLHRLLAHKRQAVAANIALKTNPSFPTARNRGPGPFGVPVTSEPGKKGLEKVWRIGAGLILVDLALVKRIPRPWFEIRYNEKLGQFMGEDWYFIEKLEAAGADIWIDHDLSREVRHVGLSSYGHELIPALGLEEAA